MKIIIDGINEINYRINTMGVNRENLKFYEYLFEEGKFVNNKNFFKFLILDLKPLDINQKNKVLELLRDLIPNIVFLEMYGILLSFYFDEIEVDFKDIADMLSDDFSTKIKVFESGKIDANKREGFKLLFEAYLRYSRKKPRLYTNTCNLILDLVEINLQDLTPLKPIILNKVYKDSQLEKLIMALFENNLNVSKTAKNVFMHRNTINNKLDYIHSETGLKIQRFNDSIAFYWLMFIK